MSKDDNLMNVPVDDVEEDEVITLVSGSGEEIDFVEVAEIDYEGEYYAIMQPVELLEDMNEDEALVFKISVDEDGGEQYEIETNDDVIDAVFSEYNRILDEEEGD